MKTYVLIKEYPGSPKLGSIVTKACDHEHYNFNGGDFTTSITGFFVENFPQFWKEISEKDYEIVAYGYDVRSLSYIKSVKRLSDGVIFTIGDMCNPASEGYRGNKRPITKIWFTAFNSLRISSDNYTLGINAIEHSKMPLFRTDDGEDIYEGDTYYHVSANARKAYEFTATKDFTSSMCGKRFFTKEAAENHIHIHEKRYSLSDIIDAIPSFHDVDGDTLTQMLDNLKVFGE